MFYDEKIKTGFSRRESNGVIFYTIDSFTETGKYRHGFSTRIGGVSEGPFESLNMSFKREPENGNVINNFALFAGAIGAALEDMVICRYEHGTNIERVGTAQRGMGLLLATKLPFCDGLIVSEPGVCAVTIHADCTPIFFANRRGGVAGVCHAGWRGVWGGIFEKITDAAQKLGVFKEDLIIGLGPSIGPCCFEVQDDVAKLFLDRFSKRVHEKRGGKQYINLWIAALESLERAGVPPENVTASGLCTSCHSELFYSYRRDHGTTGAHASAIELI